MKAAQKIPSGATTIDEVRRQLEQWRCSKKHGAPIPDDLWNSAVNLSRVHGVTAVHKILSLSYTKLKKLAEKKNTSIQKGSLGGFWELPRSESSFWPKAMGAEIELVGADGAKLVLRLTGLGEQGVTEMAAALWKRRT